MLRAAIESIGLFLLPFLIFAVYLVIRLRYPLAIEHWTRGRMATLTLIGLFATLIGLLTFGLTAQRGKGAYIPDRVEHGVLIPGHIE
jgi:hypothetical protein